MENKELVLSIVSGLAGAILGIFIQWFVNDRFQKRRDRIEFLKRQIEELYYPLFIKRQQSILFHNLLCEILDKTKGEPIILEELSDKQREVWYFFIENYFFPINKQIREIIFTKHHLLESDTLPVSFRKFVSHEMQFRVLHELWEEIGWDEKNPPERPFPTEMDAELWETLSDIQHRYCSHFKVKDKRRRAVPELPEPFFPEGERTRSEEEAPESPQPPSSASS